MNMKDGEPIVTCMADIKSEASAGESAYRRGYLHGALAAFEAFGNKALTRDMNNWEDALHEWRQQHHKGGMVVAPNPNRQD